MRALAVDDEELTLEMLEKLLEEVEEVKEVQGYTNPLEALEVSRTTKFDMAVLDIDMKEMNGIKLAEELKKQHPDMVIIFATAYEQYGLDAYKIHADGYMMKPISKHKLLDVFEYSYRRKQA